MRQVIHDKAHLKYAISSAILAASFVAAGTRGTRDAGRLHSRPILFTALAGPISASKSFHACRALSDYRSLQVSGCRSGRSVRIIHSTYQVPASVLSVTGLHQDRHDGAMYCIAITIYATVVLYACSTA